MVKIQIVKPCRDKNGKYAVGQIMEFPEKDIKKIVDGGWGILVEEEKKKPNFLLFCDNGIVGHTQKGGNGIIASAYCLINSNCEILTENCEIEKNVTNNYGELKAIKNGIIESLKLGIKKIKIYSDSEIATRGLNGDYNIQSKTILPVYLEIKELIKKFDSCEIIWISRDFNSYADYLTSIALNNFRKTKKKIIEKDICLKQLKDFVNEKNDPTIEHPEEKPEPKSLEEQQKEWLKDITQNYLEKYKIFIDKTALEIIISLGEDYVRLLQSKIIDFATNNKTDKEKAFPIGSKKIMILLEREADPEEEPEKERLLLNGKGRTISDLSNDVADILKDKNILFYKPNSNQIVEVGKIKLRNKEENFYIGFRVIKDKRFITLVEKYANVGEMIKGKFGEFFMPKSLSTYTAGVVLCSAIIEEALPQIERIFTIPIPIMHNGKLTFPKRGFDERFNSWMNDDAPEITQDITLEEAKEIIKKVFSEFCFLKPQDKTNAIAGLLTPFLRGLFKSFNTRTPIIFYKGNRERVGKEYCAGITGLIYDGQAIEETPISSGGDRYGGNNNEELRKKITSALLSGRKRYHSSNNKGYINNAVFEQVTTAEVYSDRLLGKNEIINLPNEMDYSLSGNVGITYTPDLANRCLFVNLFLDMENANAREFKNPLLHEWVKENRGLIISALYSLVQNWIEKKKPNGSVPFASFPNWASVCGGIMETAGYGSPCIPDEDALSLAGDSDTADMKTLFELCFKQYPLQSIKKNQIVSIINDSEDDLFQEIEFGEKKGQIAFGYLLKRFVGRILSDIKLVVENPKSRTSRNEYNFRKVGFKLKMV